jgi:arsenic resistance protein ArsH
MNKRRLPNHSSIGMAYKEFGEDDWVDPSSYYDHIVEVIKELYRVIVLIRPHANQLVDPYSECKEAGAAAIGEDHVAVAIGSK